MYSPKNPYYSAMTVRSGIHKPIFRKGGPKEIEEKEKEKNSPLSDIDISKMMKGFGDGSKGEYTADDWAAASLSINYEIVTRIGPRVPRIYAPHVY